MMNFLGQGEQFINVQKNKCDVHILIMSKGITSRSVSDLDKEIVSQKSL